jgi:protease I
MSIMKIAVIIADMFEDSEYTHPATAFKLAGHELVHIGMEKGAVVKGKKEQTPVTIDLGVKDASVKDYDALLIPGGYSPDKLRAHDEPVKFVRDFFETGKPVFAICHGPQLLITADVLRGRTATGYKSIAQDLKNAGVNYKDEEVVVDQNLVTSRTPKDLESFTDASLKLLG